MTSPLNEPHDDEVITLSAWTKIQRTVMMIAALMISAGQWSDTKEIVSSTYASIIENFTHTMQYELLNKIHVGNSVDYVKSLVGEPNVIKRSKIDNNVLFQYYDEGKFNLTLISSDGRLVGYSVFTQEDGFAPSIPFAEQLGSQNLATIQDYSGNYNFDIGNLTYYLESQDLSKEHMFLTLIRGYVEYGASARLQVNVPEYTKKVTGLIEALNQQETFAASDEQLYQAINSLRKTIYPNFYAITELNNAIISEALLSRYEYKTFTKS